MSFSVRPASPRDMDELLSMVRELAEQSALPCTAEIGSLRSALFTPLPSAQMLIADDTVSAATRVVGFALWRYDLNIFSGRPGLFIDDLHLQPRHRGQGIALAFFRSLAQRALAERCERLRWSTLVRNAPAISLYQSLSAIPVANWTQQCLQDDALAALAR